MSLRITPDDDYNEEEDEEANARAQQAEAEYTARFGHLWQYGNPFPKGCCLRCGNALELDEETTCSWCKWQADKDI